MTLSDIRVSGVLGCKDVMPSKVVEVHDYMKGLSLLRNVESRATSVSTLQRGQACILCRRRKTKCDGVKPVCGPCSKTTHPEHCEFTEANIRSQTEILEEKIAHLQNRIYKLEHPVEESNHEEADSIFLTKPGEVAPSAQTSAVSAVFTVSEIRLGCDQVFPPPLLKSIDSDTGHISTAKDQEVVVFLSRPSQTGFTMDRSTQSFQLPIGHPGRPYSTLVDTIRLWEMLLSGTMNSLLQESSYLSEVAVSLGQDLGSIDDPDKRIQIIQAEILLATYFFGRWRFLEGRYHAAAAMSMALSCELHKTGTGTPPSRLLEEAGFKLSLDSLRLPEARNPVELGERIRLFWIVFIVDRCWSVALGTSAILPDDHSNITRIETPWPLNMEDYELNCVGTNHSPGYTIDTFFSSPIPNFSVNSSVLEIRAKASALFERATRLSSGFDPNMNVEKKNKFLQSFNEIKRIIGDFIGALLPLLKAVDSIIEDRRLSFLTSYSLAQISVIQLHNVFVESDPGSYTFCLNAAFAVVGVLDWLKAGETEKLDPFIGVIWLAALRILYREAVAVTVRPSSSLATGGVPSSTKTLAIQGFTRLMAASEELGNKFPFVVAQLDPLKELWDNSQSSRVWM